MATVGAIVFFACVLLTAGHIHSPDEEVLFRMSESIARAGKLSIEPVAGFATRTGRDGAQYPQYPPLQSILSVPIYWFARMTRPLVSDETILRTVWPTTQYHDGSADAYWNRFWYALLFNPLITALTAVLLWAMAKRITSGDRLAAWGVALAYGLSTLALPHSRTYFTEPLAALFMLAALAALLAWADAKRARGVDNATPQDAGIGQVHGNPLRYALLAGTAAAAGVWTRVDFPLFLPGLSIGVLWLSIQRGWGEASDPGGAAIPAQPRIEWRPLFAFGIPLAVGLAGWFLFNHWRFGSAAATGYDDQPEGVQFATPFLIGLHGYLFSPGKGLFFFSPVLALALFGIGRLCKRTGGAWTAAWAVGGGLFFLLMCKWQNWSGGWCWGPRHIFQIHPLLMLGLAPLLAPPRRPAIKILAAATCAIGFFIQVFGSSQSFIDFYREFYAPSATTPPYFQLLYDPSEQAMVEESFEILYKAPDGLRPIPPQALPAPMHDSLYVPQSSQWYGYPAMLKYNKHDLFWVHLLN